MTQPKLPVPPVTFFFGLLAADAQLFEPVEKLLSQEFSPIFERSQTIPFTQTEYYNEEMGASIFRRWIAVEWMIDPIELPGAKTHTNRIETVWAESSNGELRRKVNIDPGYMDLSRVVLASCKDFSHRMYLGQGVYGEITLSYKKSSKSYEPFPWTYPDYKTPEAQEFFIRLRDKHRERAEAWSPRIWPKFETR